MNNTQNETKNTEDEQFPVFQQLFYGANSAAPTL